MTFDGILTHALLAQVQEELVGGQLKKINQIGSSQLTLLFFAKGEKKTLYLSASPSDPRFHLTWRKYQNPLQAPDFVMILRKHLDRGKLLSIDQDGMDRSIRFRFQTRNELGDLLERSLILELMGRNANLILVDEKDTVIEALRRVSRDMSRVRQIYPGKDYVLFSSNKINLLEKDPTIEEMVERLGEGSGLTFEHLFYRTLTGFSPLVSKSLCLSAGIPFDLPLGQLDPEKKEKLQKVLDQMVLALRSNQYGAYYYADPFQVYPFPLAQFGPADQEDFSLSLLLDSNLRETSSMDAFAREKRSYLHALAQALEKRNRKLDKLQEDYAETRDLADRKEEADLLAANAHLISRGQKEIQVYDFFHDQMRVLTLDPKKNGHENMEQAYKKVGKLNTAKRLLEKSIPALQENLAYLEQIQTMVQHAESLEDLLEMRLELEREGILKRPSKKKKRAKPKASKPWEYKLRSGLHALVGRNNQQNDALTLHLARPQDLFFHVKMRPGAHVILRSQEQEPSQEDLEAAAWLAATHSSLSEEDQVDVDYCYKKDVYKAKGAKPGMVYYKNYKTIRVKTQAQVQLEKIENGSLV